VGVHITCEQYDNETLFNTNMRQALHVKRDKQSGNFGKGVQSNLKQEKRAKDLESWEGVQSYKYELKKNLCYLRKN